MLTRVSRRTDLVGRWGGEEFVVALPATSESGARIATERVRFAIAEVKLALPGAGDLRVTVSVGISTSGIAWTSEGLIAVADEAMYLAKTGGRNRVHWASQKGDPGEGGLQLRQ